VLSPIAGPGGVSQKCHGVGCKSLAIFSDMAGDRPTPVSFGRPSTPSTPKLLDQVREAIRLRQLSA
jgi:hypothetical protein